MLAWCVMPNHMHVLVHVWQTPLWKLIRSWKRHVATNALPERRSPTRQDQDKYERHPPTRPEGREDYDSPAQGPALRWQREYWDTFMRDEEQERTAIRYIENNPVKARLCAQAHDWPNSSARFRDDYRRLVVPPRSESRPS